MVVEAFEDHPHVGGAEHHVGVGVAQPADVVALHAELAGHPLAGGGHDLHQALGAHAGAGCGDEAALLAHQAIHPARVEGLIAGVGFDALAVGGQVAQAVVVLVAGAVGGVDGPVVDAELLGELGGADQETVVPVAHRPVPFAGAFGAHLEAEQGQRALHAGGLANLLGLVGAEGAGLFGQREAAPELLVGEDAVEGRVAGDALELEARGVAVAQRHLGAAEPVGPVRELALLGRHGLDAGLYAAPVTGPQRGAHPPGGLLFGHRGVAGGLEPGVGVGHQPGGGLPGDLAEGVAALGGREAFVEAEVAGVGTHRVVAGQAGQRDQRQLAALALGGEADRQAVEVGGGRLPRPLELDAGGLLVGGQPGGHRAGAGKALGFHQAAHAAPGFVGAHPGFADQGLQHRDAALRRVDQREPQRARVVEGRGVAQAEAGLEVVALDVLLGLLHGRKLGRQGVPLAALAEGTQPFAAQALGQQAAALALEEVEDG